jgi:luciferase family oxidoreductase group 1
VLEAPRLSVLDQSPVLEGSTGAQALRDTVDLAQHAEELGYHRYWLAEHHGGGLVAGPSPEALIGVVAAATERMRIGSGGVMLPHYSPFKVAETFSVLAGLFPGRVDLGIGRAAGTDPTTARALDDFPQQLVELLSYLDPRYRRQSPFAHLAETLPGAPEHPDPWLLGSPAQSAIWAGELGLPYAFADFISPDSTHCADLYRERFVPREALPEPTVAVAVRALAASDRAEAETLATSWAMAFDLLRSGRPEPVPTPERAIRHLESKRGRPFDPGEEKTRLVGAATAVRKEMEEVAAAYGAEEVIVLTITHDHQARLLSYRALTTG